MNAFFFKFRRFLRMVLLCIATCCLLFAILLSSIYIAILLARSGTATLPADCAIVFGAAVYRNAIPSPAMERRMKTAVSLYHSGDIRRLIVSGGKGREDDRTEAEVMRNQAEAFGVDPQHIVLEPRARSTWENIQYARDLTYDCNEVIGISDRFHLARIEYLSWRQGWGELQTMPAGERPPPASEWRSTHREVFALLYYLFLLDRIFPGLPSSVQ